MYGAGRSRITHPFATLTTKQSLMDPVRLACVKHAASVHPEPESNPPRRRATLPHPVECSTIAVPGLSFRVRNGTGRLTWAMTAANLLLYGQTPRSAGLVAAWEPDRGRDALIRLVFIPCSLPYGMVCRRMMRSPNRSGNECCLSSVSTGRLHPSRGFHVRPIDHVFCMGTTAARGCTECLSWSRLPA